MNKILITTIVAAVIVALGLFFIGKVARMPSPLTSFGTQGSSQTNATGPVVVTTTPTGTTTQVQSSDQNDAATIDVDRSFAALLVQLQAQNLSFIAVDSSTGSMGALYKLYSSDVALSKKNFPKAEDFSIHVAMPDLNADGTAEAIVYEDLPGFCGTAGCPLDVYTKKESGWAKIFSGYNLGGVGLANFITSGYQDLLITNQQSAYMSRVYEYSWDGTTYVPERAVALWDGAQYQIFP